MSEAYRGLTIRIGADTTSLTKALRSSRNALGYINDEMVQLRKALRLDPANLVAANLKMRALGEASENTSKKFAVLLEQQRQMNAKGIGKIAEGMQNVSEYVGSAKQRYTDLTEALAKTKNEIKALSKEHEIAFSNKKPLKNEKALLAACGDEAKVLIDHYKKLVTLWKEAEGSYAQARQVQGFVELQAHIQKTSAEFKDYIRQYNDMRLGASIVKAVGEQFNILTREVEMSANAMTTLRQQGTVLREAFELDPTNVRMLGMYMDNCAEQALVLENRIKQNNEALRAMPVEAVSRAAASSFESLTLEAKRSKEAADQAAAAADEEKGKWLAAQNVLRDMAFAQERNAEQILKQHKLVNDLHASWQKLAAVAQTAFDTAEVDHLAMEVRRLENDTLGAGNELTRLHQIEEEASKTSFDETLKQVRMQLGLTGDEAQKAAEKISKVTEKSAGFNDMEKEVATLDDRFEGLFERIKFVEDAEKSLKETSKSLKKNLEFDPSNMKLMAEYAKVFADREELIRDKAMSVNEVMSLLGDEVRNVAEGSSMAKLLIDLQDMRAETKSVGQAWKQANEDLKNATEKLAKAKSEGKLTASEMKVLEERVSECRKEADRMSDAFDRAKAAQANAAGAILYKKLGAELTADTAKVNAFGDALESAGHKARSLFTGLTGLGTSLSYTVAPALQMAGMYMINWADEVDTAYRSMRKTVTGTEEQFEKMRQSALKFSETHVTSAATILEIEALGGQLGIATDALDLFARTVSNIEIATNIDAETAATDLGQLANILDDLNTDSMPNFSDSLVRLGNNNAALESNIINVTTRIGSMGSLIGMTTPEILAWSTAIAATGQKSEAAGTAVSKTLSNIESAVSSGGDKVQQFAKIAGMSADQFVNAWKTSPSMALQAFINGLAKLDSSGKSVDYALQGLGITAVRQKQALMGLAQETDVLQQALLDSQYAWEGYGREIEGVGDAQLEADKKGQGFSGALDKLRNTAQVTGATFGDALVGPIQILTKALELLNNTLGIMPNGIKTVLAAGLGLAAFSSTAVRAIASLEDNNVKLIERLKSRADATREAMNSGNVELTTLEKMGNAIKMNVKENTSFVKSKKQAANATKDVAKAAETEGKARLVNSKGYSTEIMLENAAAAAKKSGAAASTQDAAANVADAAAKDLNAAATARLTAKITMLNMAQRALNFASLAGVVVGAVSGILALGAAVGAAADSEDEFMKTHNDMMDEIKNSTHDADKQASAIEGLAAKYAELSTTEEDSVANKAKMQSVTKALASTSQELAQALGDEADASSKSADVIVGLAQAEADRVRSQAAFENYNKLLDEQISLEKSLAEASEGTNEWIGEMGMTFNGVGAAATDMANALETNKKKQAELIDQMVEDQKTAAACAKAFRNLGGASEATEDQLKSYGITAEQYAAYAQKELAQKTVEASEAFEKLIEKFPSFESALKRANVTEEGFKSKLDDAGISVDDFSTAVDNAVSQVSDAFNRLEINQDNSLDAFVSNTKNNQKLTQEWADNLKWLYNDTAVDIDHKFFKFLQTKGVAEYGKMLSQLRQAQESGGTVLVDGVEMTAQEIVSLWSSGADQAVDGMVQAFIAGQPLVLATLSQITGLSQEQLRTFAESTGVYGDEAIQQWAGSIGNELIAAKGAEDPVEAAKAVFEKFGIDISQVGEENIQQFADSLSAGSTYTAEAANVVSEEALAKLDDAAQKAHEKGDDFVSGYAEGILTGRGKVRSAGDTLANEAVSSLSYAGVQSYWKGYDFADGYANGIKDHSNAAINAAADMARDAVAAVQEAQNSGSPSKETMSKGRDFGQGYGLGMLKEYGYVKNMASGMATNAISSLGKYDTHGMAKNASRFVREIGSTANFGNISVTTTNSVTKADIYEVVAAAMASNKNDSEVAIYMDSKKIASTIAKPMNRELGTLAGRSRL